MGFRDAVHTPPTVAASGVEYVRKQPLPYSGHRLQCLNMVAKPSKYTLFLLGAAVALALVAACALPRAHALRVETRPSGTASGIPIPPEQYLWDPSEDSFWCLGYMATIIGGPGDDILEGTNGRDVIHGRGGDDTLHGMGGDDLICGGSGDDIMFGGEGKDFMRGRSGNDFIHGGPGADTVLADDGNDELVGHDGRDFLSGSDGDDIIIGGDLLLEDHQRPRLTGRDVLLGGVGSDIIIGDDGDDGILGFGASDFMAGLGGNDTIYGYSGDDLLDGGEGVDECKGGTGEDTAAECEIEEAVERRDASRFPFLD